MPFQSKSSHNQPKSKVNSKTALKNIIDNEGITMAELSKISGVNYTTIIALCKGEFARNGKIVDSKIATKSKIVNGINSKFPVEKYTFEQVFPPKR